MLGQSKIGNFLKRLEECSQKQAKPIEKSVKNPKHEKALSISQSLMALNVRTPSTKALLALGLLPLEADKNRLSTRVVCRKGKADRSMHSKSINRNNSSLISNEKALRNVDSAVKMGRSTTRDNIVPKPRHHPTGSQTERSLNVVNNFNVKINEESSSEKANYEIADLKLNLQMKALEASSLTQSVKELKKTNRRLEQDNLQLRQELEEMNDKLTSAQQNWEYYKSLSQLKSDELISLNTKVNQLKKQVSTLGGEDNFQQTISNWGTTLMKVIADARPESSNNISTQSTQQPDSLPNPKNRDQLKKLIIEIESSSKAFTPEAISFLADLIDPTSFPALSQAKDQINPLGSNQPQFLAKVALLLNIYREVVREEFVTRRELHKTTASIHQHYVTRMNAKQLEFHQQLANHEKTIAKYRMQLTSQLKTIEEEAADPHDPVISEDRYLDNYIDNAELDRLHNHDIESVSLIYSMKDSLSK